MNISIFDVTGPVMTGPSSSHTAGAARLARVAARIVGKPFNEVSFGLHGSFAKTYKGHGTDCALVAGALGMREDDERIARAFSIADERGLEYDFYETDLGDMHENSVIMTFRTDEGDTVITGSSIGGGQIVIKMLNGFPVDFTAQSSSLIIRQDDKPGMVSAVAAVLAEEGINIGIMKLSRKAKGSEAFCVIETDSPIPDGAVERIRAVEGVNYVIALNVEAKE